MKLGQFILGAICGLILGGGFAIAQVDLHQGPVTVEGMMKRNHIQPQAPQMYMDQQGHMQQLQPLNQQRPPC